MKVKIVPAHKKGGVQCYAFVEGNHREAYKVLTNQNTASRRKLDALSAFGVQPSIIGETTTQ